MIIKNLSFYISLLITSIKASTTNRGAFLLQSAFMIANNLIFFSVWWIFFRQFNDIAGWQIKDMNLLMAIGVGGYGLKQICSGGAKSLSRIIINGELDPFMTQPKNVLVHIVGSRSFSKGWGHLMSSAVLLMLSGLTQFPELPIVILGIICGGIIFSSMEIIAHSLTFWLGPIEGLANQYGDSLFLFALYPTNIYSGFLQIVLFTIVPAGMIGYIPVELIREFSWIKLFGMMSGALFFLVLAFGVFHLGLKRYESGNQFTTR